MNNHLFLLLCIALCALTLGACRGKPSEKPPIHTQSNMYWQDRFNAQQENPFFEDGRAMRMPVEGTIARGHLQTDHIFYEGVDSDGRYVTEIPVDVTRAFLYRGQEVYNIYCTPCHGGAGDGNGPVSDFGYIAASLHTDNARAMPDGEIYSA
ncbi:cytochrome c, partial [Balneolaceae bacterium ANBcel3]|nr:cytochrome c [Balneolaceae bacterium ANBcel3]